MKQAAVSKHALVIRRRRRADRRAPEMKICAEPLVSEGRHVPSRFTDPKRKIGFVPLGRCERFVEHTDFVETRAADDPGTYDGVDFLKIDPVRRPYADGALEPLPV